MSLTRKLAHNTAAQFVGKGIGTLLAVIALSQLFRYLGPNEYGRFHIVLTIVQFSGIIADFGLYLIVLNDISEPRYNASKIVSQHIIFRLYLNIVYVLTMGVVALIVPYDNVLKWGIVLMSTSNVFIWFGQIFQTVFQKHFATYYSAISEIIGRTVLLAATVIMIALQLPLLPLMMTVVLGSFITCVVSAICAHKFIRISWRLDPLYIREVIFRTWPIALSIVFNLLYFKADTIILSLYADAYAVGIYGMPYRILETLIQLPLIIMGLFMPILTKARAKHDEAEFRQYVQKGFDIMAFLSIPLLLGSLPLAGRIVRIVGGSGFAESAPVLQILMIGVVLMFFTTVFGHSVVALHKQKTMIKYYGIIAGLMLFAYLVFIPRYSYFAAAWLTVIGEVLIYAASFYVVYRETHFIPKFGVLVKSFVSAILMSGVVYFLREWTIFFTIPFGMALYVFCVYIFRGIKKETVKEILVLKGKQGKLG